MKKIETVFNFIRTYRAMKGVSPTYREIGRACAIRSTSNVKIYLEELERQSRIKRYPGVARGIVLLETA